MKKLIKKILKEIFFLVAPFLGKLFYKKKYLKGRYYTKYGEGWWWVYRGLWYQKILGFNRGFPVPISHTTRISNFTNFEFGEDSVSNLLSPGCYFQNFSGKIVLGNRVFIAPNVGLITANHDLDDLKKHMEGKDIIIGDDCWIGMNSVVLPGVKLGTRTIVGAGSVVTKSFEEGNVVIAGNPARVVKQLSPPPPPEHIQA